MLEETLPFFSFIASEVSSQGKAGGKEKRVTAYNIFCCRLAAKLPMVNIKFCKEGIRQEEKKVPR